MVKAHIFNLTAEHAIPTETSTNEANEEIKIQSLAQKKEKNNSHSNLKPCTIFYAF